MNKSEFYDLVAEHFDAKVSDDLDIADLPAYSSITVFTLIDKLEKQGVKVSIDVILDSESLSELYEEIFDK